MIDALIERIRAEVPAVRFVGRAVDFQTAAETNPKVTPACFVIPVRESPGKPMASDVMQQKVDVTVGIIFVHRNLADGKGAAAGADLDAIRKAVRDKVYGWEPSAEYDPFERGGGHLLAFRDGHVWWQDHFQTSYFDRSVL